MVLIVAMEIKGIYYYKYSIHCNKYYYRFEGLCDKNGCDFNPFRSGNQSFYGIVVVVVVVVVFFFFCFLFVCLFVCWFLLYYL
jgi:Glycosyl hydrolase family 7